MPCRRSCSSLLAFRGFFRVSRQRLSRWLWPMLCLLPTAAHAESPITIFVPLEEIVPYHRDAFSREVTLCDQLAAHPDDPEAVVAGVVREVMDKPAAITACKVSVEQEPDNPRLRYQLARAYGYSGQHALAMPHREAALRAGYPQSLFVMGYIRLTGWDGATPDPCYGGELILRSARVGRLAGLLGFPHYAGLGYFKDCAAGPQQNKSEMLGFLDSAALQTSDFYQQALIAQLRDAIGE